MLFLIRNDCPVVNPAAFLTARLNPEKKQPTIVNDVLDADVATQLRVPDADVVTKRQLTKRTLEPLAKSKLNVAFGMIAWQSRQEPPIADIVHVDVVVLVMSKVTHWYSRIALRMVLDLAPLPDARIVKHRILNAPSRILQLPVPSKTG